MKTKDLEAIAYKNLWKQGTYLCFEVAMPNPIGRIMVVNERVDLLSYETSGIWRFYELKVSVSDFHSKNKTTFYGNYNYYVMPEALYEKVKDEIPKGIGVYVASEDGFYPKWRCAKRPIKRELTEFTSEQLMFQLMQALSRENQKQMRKRYTEVSDRYHKEWESKYESRYRTPNLME